MKTWIKLVVATALVGTTMQAMSAEGRAVTPEGMRALKDIGAALRDLDAYEVQMKVTTRVATEDGKYRIFSGRPWTWMKYVPAVPGSMSSGERSDRLDRIRSKFAGLGTAR